MSLLLGPEARLPSLDLLGPLVLGIGQLPIKFGLELHLVGLPFLLGGHDFPLHIGIGRAEEPLDLLLVSGLLLPQALLSGGNLGRQMLLGLPLGGLHLLLLPLQFGGAILLNLLESGVHILLQGGYVLLLLLLLLLNRDVELVAVILRHLLHLVLRLFVDLLHLLLMLPIDLLDAVLEFGHHEVLLLHVLVERDLLLQRVPVQSVDAADALQEDAVGIPLLPEECVGDRHHGRSPGDRPVLGLDGAGPGLELFHGHLGVGFSDDGPERQV